MALAVRDAQALAREFRQFLLIWTLGVVALHWLTGWSGWWGILRDVALGAGAVFVFAVCTTERLYLFAGTEFESELESESESESDVDVVGTGSDSDLEEEGAQGPRGTTRVPESAGGASGGRHTTA